MKTILAVTILQLILLVAGSDVAGDRKRVVCYYMGLTIGSFNSKYADEFDISTCTHLMYLNGAINKVTEEIYLTFAPQLKTGGEGYVPRLAKLKALNPDLKLILHIADPDYSWISEESSRESKIIQSGVKWLNASGFDGLDISLFGYPDDKDGLADFYCKMKTEFDKHGYELTSFVFVNSFLEPKEGNAEFISKMARCWDHISLHVSSSSEVTYRRTPLSLMKSNVDKYMEMGLPANKILIFVRTNAILLRLEDPSDTGLGAKVAGCECEHHPETGTLLRYRELRNKMNDSSLEWTIRRDNETKEPYAFTSTGLWTSYEDPVSMEYKARYVLEKGLGGIAINILETDDIGPTEGEEERFPLTSVLRNTFSRGLQSADTTSLPGE